jgi:hypothetical protein
MALYFETMVRGVDSSLLEDWEKMRAAKASGAKRENAADAGPAAAPPWTDAEKVRLARNESHRLVRALAAGDLEAALGMLAGGPPKDELEKALKDYLAGHQRLRTGPKARAPVHTRIEKGEGSWRVEQILLDPEDHDDWSLRFELVFLEDRKAELRWAGMGPV